MSTDDEARGEGDGPDDGDVAEGWGDDNELLDPPGIPGLGGLGSIAPLSGLTGLFGQARDQLEEVAEQAGNVVVTGRAGGGSVEIEMTGNLDAVAVRINRDVVDPDDVGMLEDLVLAALRHALSDALEVREQAASTVFPPSLDLGAMMQGLFGGTAGPAGAGQVDAGAAGLLGAFGGSMPTGMPPAIGDFMNELFGPDGPIADFGFGQPSDDLDTDDDTDDDIEDDDDLGDADEAHEPDEADLAAAPSDDPAGPAAPPNAPDGPPGPA